MCIRQSQGKSVEGGIAVDISVSDDAGVQAGRIMNSYFDEHRMARPLLRVLKAILRAQV